MEVFVVTDFKRGSDNTLGTFSTMEKAKKLVEKTIKKENSHNTYKKYSDYEYEGYVSIHQMTLDEEIKQYPNFEGEKYYRFFREDFENN